MWYIYTLIITLNTSIPQRIIEKYEDYQRGDEIEITYEADEIELDIPVVGGIKVDDDKWHLLPVQAPVVSFIPNLMFNYM